MDRATPTELAAWRSRFGAWRTPALFARAVAGMKRKHGDYVLDQPGSPWRDAYVASKCATAWGADRVRLGADPPDFELAFGDQVERYEVVEVQAPGRRRGDELKADRLKSAEEREQSVHIPDDGWTSAAAVLHQIAAAVANKMAKSYLPNTQLVIYLNVWPVKGERHVRSGLAEAVAPALSRFKRVWVLDDGQLERPVGLLPADPARGPCST